MNTVQKYRVTGLIILWMGLWGGFYLQAQGTSEKPQNVILMIGDGMGLSQLSSPYYYMEEEGEPAFSRFKYIGLARTSSG